MASRKRTYLIIGALLAYGIFIFLVYLWAMSPQSKTSRLEEEQKIYSSIIHGSAMLEGKTTLKWSDLSKETIEYIKNGLPEIEQETLINFQESNREAYPLKEYFPASSVFIFLSETELEKIDQDEWGTFYENYPHTYGISSLSRIGFNSSFSQALVLKGFRSTNTTDDETFSEGTYILLQIISGTWTIIREISAWIS